MNFEDYKTEQLKDPEFRAAYENPPISMVIARTVVLRRKELGINQTELANAMKTSQTQVWRIESGQYNPTLKTIQKLEDALGIELRSGVQAGQDKATATPDSDGDLIDAWWNEGFFKVDEETFWQVMEEFDSDAMSKLVAFGKGIRSAGLDGFGLVLSDSPHQSSEFGEPANESAVDNSLSTNKGLLTAAI